VSAETHRQLVPRELRPLGCDPIIFPKNVSAYVRFEAKRARTGLSCRINLTFPSPADSTTDAFEFVCDSSASGSHRRSDRFDELRKEEERIVCNQQARFFSWKTRIDTLTCYLARVMKCNCSLRHRRSSRDGRFPFTPLSTERTFIDSFPWRQSGMARSVRRVFVSGRDRTLKRMEMRAFQENGNEIVSG
jgi:hypothetical protein